jgi:SAM-dependent methyltransferase
VHPTDPDRERAELREYLGDAYSEERLRGYARLVDQELAEIGDEQRLYRVSEAYLYDLTAFAMTGTKDPYLAWIPTAPPALSLLDFGCGIGSDGLRLLEAGHRVTFADFDNPSTRYLRWRLEHRGLDAPIADVDGGLPDGPFDLAYAFDVLEHLEDPFAALGALERRSRRVLVNLLEGSEEGGIHHRELPVRALLDHVTQRGLVRHEVFHGRSHLVLYEPGRTGPPRTAGG